MTRIEDWSALTGPELAAIGGNDPVALLPVAAIEQHGPHLPLATDVTIGAGIIDAACNYLRSQAAALDLVVMPCLVLGASLEHTSFAGTLSLGAEQAIAQIRAVGAGAAAAGIRRLVIFNSHGGNKAVLDLAALKLRAEFGMLAVKASYFRFAPPANALAAEELAHGLHGGALETSMMLHLAPRSVRSEALADHPGLGARRARAGATLGPEGDAGFAWMAEDLHPAGVAGNAAAADAATGARLVETFGRRLAQIVVETAAFDPATLGGAPGE
ncbi:creatininase family protein [Salinisphaera sp.]|uniref:creatininase family protein n=1 Tax=Salinisphaera sp. TaxID=1914330 RepID=UPI002D7A25BF|nr:creatininase family protein [Salinisphaera sp.]HET7314491.1 creatininase family protein [Salinisphaera sp.]